MDFCGPALQVDRHMASQTQDRTLGAARDWDEYWQGRTAQSSGAALVGVERDGELDTFWAGVFANAPESAAILDMACGAGTVLRAARAAGHTELTGLDISPDALAALANAMPGIATVVASADAPPFAPASFDLVTSQFGVEYASITEAAAAVAALLRPGGRIVWLTHLAGGAIAEEVAGKAEAANTLLSGGFIPAARALFTAPEAEFEAAAGAFREPQATVLALAKSGDPLAAHLYAGTQRMYQRRAAYALDDILAWYDGTEAQVRAFAGRMSGMLAAAVDDALAETVCGIWRDRGLHVPPSTTLALGGCPAARILSATQPLA